MPRLKFIEILRVGLLMLSATGWLKALDFTVTWPPDAQGSYSVILNGQQHLVDRTTSSGTFTAQEKDTIRIVGTGFDAGFSVLDGKIHFVHNEPPKITMGIRIDVAGSAVTFVPVEVDIALKNAQLPVAIDGTPIPVADASGLAKMKVIYGKHTLTFSKTKQTFNVDGSDFISLDDPGEGIALSDSTITLEGQPFQVATGTAGWKIDPLTAPSATGNGTVYLLPGDYTFHAQNVAVPFSVDKSGLLSLVPGGPFAEFIPLAGKGETAAAKIMIPNGEAIYDARMKQQAADQALHDKVLTASAAAAWKHDFTFAEKMEVYDFPEQQVSYPLELPEGTTASEMKLLEFTDDRVRVVPFQSSESGKEIFFRSDLPMGSMRVFRLLKGFDTTGIPNTTPVPPTVQAGQNSQETILSNDQLVVDVPAGHQDFPGGKPLSQVTGPILGIARKAKPLPWIATSSFAAPDTIKVDSMDAKQTVSGALFTRYEIAYKLEGGKNYTVTLELRANEPMLRIAEAVDGFAAADGAFLRLNYGKGNLDPDRRLVASNGGYDSQPAWSGPYDANTDPAGKLNYCLGLFQPNALGVMHATAFYQLHGTDAMLVVLDRMREWHTEERALWSSAPAVENLRFYSQGDEKYMTAGLAGPKRFWVISLIPSEDMKRTMLPFATHALAAGPEVRLYNELTDWSLQGYKNRAIDWPETLKPGPFASADFEPDHPKLKMTYDEYVDKFLTTSTFFNWVVGDSWDFSGEIGAVSFRGMPNYFGNYAVSRADWTPEQRERIRDILLFFADSCEDDANQPHHSMLSGHPNFIMDVKSALPMACATFPNYPRAKVWRSSFQGFFDEWLDRYDRKDVPDLNTKGGRWTENISCYVGQCFSALQMSEQSLKAYDGSSLGKNPQLLTLIRWMRDSFMSPHDGVRMIPPEGAHSFNFQPERPFNKIFFQFCDELSADDPQLSAEMKWIHTNGKEGRKPDVRSTLFTDYGAVLHSDFGGPHESYAHMQNIFGSNYRWGGAGCIYYGAKGKVWSYNNTETNGDDYDITSISAFNVNKQGLHPGPTDQLLYDFGFAQFYRQPQYVKEGQVPGSYLARGVMLLRDDYLVVADEVKDNTVAGTFNWVSVYDLPQIYQLKPGAPLEKRIARDPQPPREGNPDRIGNVLSYSGKGDFLTVVAPTPVQATATPFGATVNGEYVFASQQPENITSGPATFSGTYGYARANQLALFQGTTIALDGFALRRDGGDFGVSASADGRRITGRIVGRSGGKIFIVPPKGLDPASASVIFDGKPVPHAVEQGAVAFSFDIAQRDGLKEYRVSF